MDRLLISKGIVLSRFGYCAYDCWGKSAKQMILVPRFGTLVCVLTQVGYSREKERVSLGHLCS